MTNTKIRIHLAAGTVYLTDGWLNVDIAQPHYFLAKDRSDLVEKNGTDYEHYYKEEVSVNEFKRGQFHQKEAVVDMFKDIRNLSFPRESVDEMLGVQILEHFSLIEAKELLTSWLQMIKRGGSLELHVPDVKGIIDQYNKDNDIDWAIRQIYGSQKNQYSLHPYGYTNSSLTRLLREVGFSDVQKIPTINSYPSVSLKAIK